MAVRQVRHEANDKLKSSQKNKEISEDEERDGLKKIQDLTDEYIGKIAELQKKDFF